jgi:DNA-binding MarR family transcriptional regulator
LVLKGPERALQQWDAVGLDGDLGTLAVTMRLLRTAALLNDRLEACVATYGFRVKGDFDTVAILRRSPSSMPATKLAELLLVSPAGMTSRFDRLEDAGLLVRGSTSADRRMVTPVLTPAGEETFDSALRASLQLQGELLDGLSAEERQQLAGLLKVVAIELGDVAR